MLKILRNQFQSLFSRKLQRQLQFLQRQFAVEVSNKIKMIGQNQLLNYFVAEVRQMLNLINQNKQHVRKHTTILQVMTT